MKVIDNADDFLAEVQNQFGPVQPFEPTVTYIPDGDCVELIAQPGRYYARRLDDRVTLLIGEESGEIVGLLIKGVREFYRQLNDQYPGFKITLEDGRVRLAHLFLAYFWSHPAPDELAQRSYRSLIKAAESTHAAAEIAG